MYHTMSDTYMWLKKEMNYTESEIKTMSVGKINLLIQRANEPIYKKQIIDKIHENEIKTRK